MIAQLAGLIKRLGRFPTSADLRIETARDNDLPNAETFYRLGSREQRIELVRLHAAQRPEDADVLDLLPAPTEAERPQDAPYGAAELVDGSVYMMRLGVHYKIGHTSEVPRRHREISLELPEKPDLVHVIKTDDPSGIEVYWHSRFAAKRTNGEWLALPRENIRAFKRRKFM